MLNIYSFFREYLTIVYHGSKVNCTLRVSILGWGIGVKNVKCVMLNILTHLTIYPPSDRVIVTVTQRKSQSSNKTGKYPACSPLSRIREKCPLQVIASFIDRICTLLYNWMTTRDRDLMFRPVSVLIN